MVLKNLFTGQQWRNRLREQTYRQAERGGKGEMCGKSNLETYITICKIDNQREFAVWLRKLKWALCKPRGVGWGERWEGASKGRRYMYIYGWFMWRFDRKQQNSVKQLSFNKKINWKQKHHHSFCGRIKWKEGKKKKWGEVESLLQWPRYCRGGGLDHGVSSEDGRLTDPRAFEMLVT